jgi:flagellar biosynthetic protein FlhB
MAQESAAERTEQATPKRKEQARKEGQVARSSEVVSTLIMVLVCGVILWWIVAVIPWLVEFTRGSFRLDALDEVTTGGAPGLLGSMGAMVGRMVIPVALIGAVIAMVANFAQIGFSVNWELVGIKWNRINPANWFKRIFSAELPIGLLKALFKGLGIIAIAAWGLRDQPEELGPLVFATTTGVGEHMQELAFTIFVRVTIAMTALAIFDILWTRFQHEKKLRMTKQELRDEMKESEGDPYLKAALRRRMREMATNSLVSKVEDSTMVVRNPTHFAVALRYERGKDASPRVMAKGRGHKALRIIDLAEKAGVPVIEDRPLARTLFSSVKEGKIIPADLFRAVARLLAVIYRQKGLTAEEVA